MVGRCTGPYNWDIGLAVEYNSIRSCCDKTKMYRGRDEKPTLAGPVRRRQQLSGLRRTAGTSAIYSGGTGTSSPGVENDTIFKNMKVSLTNAKFAMADADTSDKDKISAVVSSADERGVPVMIERVDELQHGSMGRVYEISFKRQKSPWLFFVLKLEKFKLEFAGQYAKSAALCAAMNECGLVRYQAWMGALIKVTVMERMRTDLHTHITKGAFMASSGFKAGIVKFLETLISCLKKHNTSYADLKPENIGVGNGYTFRLLDLDSINLPTYTPPYSITPDETMALFITTFRRDPADFQLFLRTSTIFCALVVAAMVSVCDGKPAEENRALDEIYRALDHRAIGRRTSVKEKVDTIAEYARRSDEMGAFANGCVREIDEYFKPRELFYNYRKVDKTLQ